MRDPQKDDRKAGYSVGRFVLAYEGGGRALDIRDEQGTGRKLSFLVQVSERSSEWSEHLRLQEAWAFRGA